MKTMKSLTLMAGIAAIVGMTTAPGAFAQSWHNFGQGFLHGGVNSGTGIPFVGNLTNNYQYSTTPYFGNGNSPFSSLANNGSCHNHNFNNGFNNTGWNNYNWSSNNTRRMLKERIKQINNMARAGQISPQQAMALDAQLRAEYQLYVNGSNGGFNNYAYPTNVSYGNLNNLNFGTYSDPNFMNYLGNSNPALMTRFLSFLGI